MHCILTERVQIGDCFGTKQGDETPMTEIFREKHKQVFILFLVFIVLVRVVLFISSEPSMAGDTSGYERLAFHILELNLGEYDGERSAGYPLVIALSGVNYELVMIFQMVMGIILSVALFHIAYLITNNTLLSLISGLFPTLYFPLLLFETVMLTETTASLCVGLSFLFLLLFHKSASGGKKQTWWLLLAGITSSFAALNKPVLIMVPLCFGLYLVFRGGKVLDVLRKPKLSSIVVFSMPVVLLVGSWIFVIYHSTGQLGLTTATGFSLMGRADDLIENLPESNPDIEYYGLLREIYLSERDKNQEDKWSTIWAARKVMQEKTGLKYHELSNLVRKMAIATIANAPLKYVKEFIKGYVRFWRPTILIGDTPRILKIISKYVERVVLGLLVVLFHLFFLLYIASKKFRERFKNLDQTPRIFLKMAYAVLLMMSIFQALLVHSLPRFSVTVDSILVVTTLFIVWYLYTVKKKVRDTFSQG